MYKVIIVDDESIIIEGMTKNIPWEKWNCRVVATATDGETAWKIIEKHRPHMIFTDIKMPGIDGLRMIAGLASEFSDVEITILTGYKKFEYAQTAIRLGVRRFLIKPIVIKEVEEAIETMVENIRIKENLSYKDTKEEHLKAANCFVVKNALQYIEEHYNEKLTLLETAEYIYVSQWHLSKLLNKHVGKGFSKILNIVRISHAKELLEERSLLVGEVAEIVGFHNAAHFSRVFKKMVGVSPNEYRNRIK